MPNTQFSPGEIKSFGVKANGVDISSMVLQADIYMELFSPTWSSQISFVDTQNLLMNIPIKPGTQIELTLETDYPENKKKTFRFVVYKISDRVQLGQENQGYILNCVTKEFFINQKKRVSKAYQSMSPQDMVNAILTDYSIGTLADFHSDSNKYTVIVPNMSPFAAVNWITKFTMGQAADFWFYQSEDGEFKFQSYEKMLQNHSGVVFKQSNPNRMDDSSNVPLENFLNIEHYEFLTQHDSMNNYAAGYYGNTVVSHDLYNKSFSTRTYAYGDDIAADKNYAPFDEVRFAGSQNSNITFNPMNTGLFGNNIQAPNDTSEAWTGSRKSNVMKMEENRLVMTVPGAVSHYELLGKQVNVELPSHQDVDENEYLDKYMKGSYVVTAIRHTVTSTFYKVMLELGKKRLENSING